MKYKEYVEKRQGLLNETQAFIDAGKLEEADAKMEEVKKLDEKWDAVTEAQANMRTLSGNQRTYDVQQLCGAKVEDGIVTAKMNFGMKPNEKTEEAEEMYKSDTYERAWAKTMMGKLLTAEEANVMQKVNAYTHTTENTGVVIPHTVASGIWDMAEEMYPYWNDVQKTYVKGTYSTLIGEESTDAAWYDESTDTEDGKEHIKELSLTGCELSRAITISWKLREMAIEDFIPYIMRKMAKKMGTALGYGATHGKGKPTANEFKPEPLGVVTALKKEEGTPQVATYVKNSLTYKDIINTRARVKIGASGLKIYANNQTIWNELAGIVDGVGKPMFVPDPVNSGVYRILGMEVKEDASFADGEILMSNADVGYLSNVNKEMSVLPEEHVKERTVDYCAYAIVDGGATTTKAHAMLEYKGE